MGSPEVKTVSARVWPHRHTQEFGGPLDVKIGVTRLPAILWDWDRARKPLFCLEQPMVEISNFTLLRILFLKSGPKPEEVKGLTMHQGNVWTVHELPPPRTMPIPAGVGLADVRRQWRAMKPTHLTVYIRGRYNDQLPHPVPLGKWEGTLIEDRAGRWVLFSLQAVSLRVQKVETKRNILLPGDKDFGNTYRTIS